MTRTTTGARSSRLRRTVLAATVTASGLLLAACGSGGDAMGGMDHGSTKSAPAAGASPNSATAPAAPAGSFNDADVTFAQQMIPHHQQALEMAALAGGRAQDPEVKTLASAVEKAQDPEILTMRSWLKAWGRPESATGSAMPGMDHGTGSGMNHGTDHGMAGMMSEQDMTDLAAAKGTDFDKKFARLMVAHHQGAVQMAKTEQTNGKDAKAKQLAGDVVTNQSAEIAQLNKILARL